jgi:hypothetical protein
MSLLAVHRALILSFVGFALLFGWKMFQRHRDAGEPSGLAGAIVAVVVAAACLVYLAKAPHLRRK